LTIEKLSLNHFKETFELFRGRLRGSPRLINQLHLSILANISVLESSENLLPVKKLVAKDLKAFYRPSEAYKRRLDEFLIKKKVDIEIHETVTRIGVNMTKNCELSAMFLETQFYNDIIETLILIGLDDDPNDTVRGDFLQRIIGKKSSLSIDRIKRFVQGIIENTLIIIINILKGSKEVSQGLTKKVLFLFIY
jgi:hypothetical protein